MRIENEQLVVETKITERRTGSINGRFIEDLDRFEENHQVEREALETFHKCHECGVVAVKVETLPPYIYTIGDVYVEGECLNCGAHFSGDIGLPPGFETTNFMLGEADDVVDIDFMDKATEVKSEEA